MQPTDQPPRATDNTGMAPQFGQPNYAPQQPGYPGVMPAQQPNQLPTQAPVTGQQQPLPQPKQQNTTQNSLLISEIRENMVIMHDGSFRAVVACESINFDLMSSREREGIEYSYQNFLNSLYFPVQIFIRSQRVDIGPYIDRLVTIRRAQDNMLLNVLMDDYIDFIDQLSQEANIMDKTFYITVPYYPVGNVNAIKEQTTGLVGKIFGGAKVGTSVTKIDQVTYEKAKDEIGNRTDLVMNGLFQIGVKSYQLTTRELGELYYNVYNPDTAVRQPLGNFENQTTTFVRKGEGEALRPHLQEGDV